MNKSVEDLITDNGYENVVIFKDPNYSEAFLGVSEDNRAVYDYDLMIKSLCTKDKIDYLEAIEFIEYNTIRSLNYVKKRTYSVTYVNRFGGLTLVTFYRL